MAPPGRSRAGQSAGNAGLAVSPRKEAWLAWLLFAISIVMYPVSATTFAKNEPPTVLFLSFLAITLQCLEYTKSARIHREQQEEAK